jgi:DNA helicase-2/ATP-dependent DNA helicase PcrA
MTSWVPTDAQRELIESDGSRFVEACPGSGKTRAIVARYERLTASRSRRGVALLSFTNAAVDEVTARCADPAVLDPPNFVGTFDSFINKFITGPYVASQTGSYPRFIDSWSSIPGATVRVPAMQQGLEFKLDWFDWSESGAFVLERRRVSGQYANALLNAYDASATSIDQAASTRRRELVKDRQIVSCAASRHIATWLLSDETNGVEWGGLLASRFTEIIVDEAQDCGAEELRVLQAAHDNGVAIVMVADLDQAIYEFRRAKPDDVRGFASKLPEGTPLTGNFRSSPAVCRAGGALRFGFQDDEPVGPNQENDWPVRVIEFSNLGEVAPLVRGLLDEHGLAPDECKVLAHRRRDASGASGAAPSNSTAGHKVLRIARAHLVLRADPNPAHWRQAVAGIERLLLEVAWTAGSTDLEHAGSLADRLGVNDRWLRASALRLLHGARPDVGRVAYALEVRRIVQGLDWPGSVELLNVGNQLATPPQAKWDELALDPPVTIPWGTIHSVKGREFEAVALIIPQQPIPDADGKTCLDLWADGVDGESRRVLYVGATRARRLLIVAVHTTHADRVRDLLPSEIQV